MSLYDWNSKRNRTKIWNMCIKCLYLIAVSQCLCLLEDFWLKFTLLPLSGLLLRGSSRHVDPSWVQASSGFSAQWCHPSSDWNWVGEASMDVELRRSPWTSRSATWEKTEAQVWGFFMLHLMRFVCLFSFLFLNYGVESISWKFQ